MGTVRMGEIQVSKRPGDELVTRGLGSCIGLALIDRQSGVAGMAHIVLPESAGSDDELGKFADLAVPALIAEMARGCSTSAAKWTSEHATPPRSRRASPARA